MTGPEEQGRCADLTVVVPSAYRPGHLERCLAALCAQSLPPAGVVAVLRVDDEAGRAACARRPNVRVQTVSEEGVIPALRAGVRAAVTGWVAFMDDDAEPAPDWCERLCGHMDDPTVGCIGGPIVNFVAARSTSRWFTSKEPVARLSWRGPAVSHLHDRPDEHRVEDVDFLPGSNMALRRELALEADHGRAPGLAPNHELEWCLTVKDAGLRVLYDSAVRVAHYSADRVGAPDRADKAAYAYAFAYMLTHAMLRHGGPARSVLFLASDWVLGRKVCPGAALAPLYALRPSGLAKTASGMRGRWQAMLDSIRRTR